MAVTTVLPTDAGAVKVWNAEIALDAVNKMYFTKMTGPESAALPVLIKTELESGPGDEVTSYLVAKFVGKPIEGAEKGEGREQKLSSYTHTMKIDKHRQLVNCGDIMTQKRTPFQIAEQVKARLGDYWAEVTDQQITMHAAGARGVGSEITQYPTSYTGFPNAFVTPDTGHIFYAGAGTKVGLTASDKMTTDVLDKVIAKTKAMYGGPGNTVKMTPVDIDGGKHLIALLGVEQMYDIRREVGDAGWLTLEKAKAAQDGAKNPIFQGGAAYYNGALLDEVQHYVKFSDYGSGSTVAASRGLMLGAHAVAVAYGMKNKTKSRYESIASDLDHHEEDVVVTRVVAGFSKCRHNSMDFGVFVFDTAYTSLA